jgi:hypothetical protein
MQGARVPEATVYEYGESMRGKHDVSHHRPSIIHSNRAMNTIPDAGPV